MKAIGVFTSGGDSPGMNACIRAVVRSGLYQGLRVYGIRRGYEGMIDGDIVEMDAGSVSNIIQRGGTILKTARSARFRTAEGMTQAHAQLQALEIGGVVAIGGDGTFAGAREFHGHYGIPFVGTPGTIDNDLYGTDYTIGYDTALNTAVEAIDRIRDTADAHNRLFFVEVMGKDAGFIALNAGLGGGAEAILMPESGTDLNALYGLLEKGWQRQKTSFIVVVAEGDDAGGAFGLAGKVKERFPQYDTRVTVLGHIQRGGSPTCLDRVLATELGVAAVQGLLDGRSNVMAGRMKGEIRYTPFEQAIKYHQQVNRELLKMLGILGM